MTAARQVQLFTTAGCRLCDEAQGFVAPIARRLGIQLSACDVLDDPAWEAAYATRIPVLRRADTGAELDWPFNAAAVYRFLL